MVTKASPTPNEEKIPARICSCGNSNDLTASLPGFLIGDDNDSTGFSDSLLSESSNGDEDSFNPSGQETKPPAGESKTGHAGRAPSPPVLGVDLWDVCKRTANKLVISWPNAVAETTTSR